MAVRTKCVFLTLEEFAEWLVPLARQLNVAVAVPRGPHQPLQGWDGVAETLVGARWVYLAPSPVDLGRVRADNLVPQQLGWVGLDVPRTDGDRLFECQFGVKSHWYDSDSGQLLDNPATILLFEKVWRRWKKHFKRPVWVLDRITGAGRPYRDIGYSKGAEEWFLRGGKLRQEGTLNNVYSLRPPGFSPIELEGLPHGGG